MVHLIGEKFQLIGEICAQDPRADADTQPGAQTAIFAKLDDGAVCQSLKLLLDHLALCRADCVGARH